MDVLKKISILFMLVFLSLTLFAQELSDFILEVHPNQGDRYMGSHVITITGYTGTSREVKIPWEIYTIWVTAIGKDAFRGKNLTKVELTSRIKTIEQGAFADNPLTSIWIGTETRIEPDSFGQVRFNEVYVQYDRFSGLYTRPNAQSTEWRSGAPGTLNTGAEYRVLQYRANVRSAPGINSEIIAILSINDKVSILENTGMYDEINGALAYWYKVQYGRITGYIFGGNLAERALSVDMDGNGNMARFFVRYTNPHQWSNFDAHTDVFIYMNGRRINTSMLNAWSFNTHGTPFSPAGESDLHHFDNCVFEDKGDHVLVKLIKYGRHSYWWTTIYKIDRNGNIGFYEWWEDDLVCVRKNADGTMKYYGQIGGYWEGWDQGYIPEEIKRIE